MTSRDLAIAIGLLVAADGSGAYAPYVSGSGTQYPAPFVLTASKVGGHFTTRALKTNKKGVIAKAQMWQLISGVLPLISRSRTYEFMDCYMG